MPLKKLRRKPAELDSLSLYATLGIGKADDRDIDHPDRIDEFIAEIGPGLKEALSRPSTIYGWHVQNFFGAVVTALDGVKLLKEEDGGAIYSDERVKVPDWSIVLNNGRRILVEVKSVGPDDTTKGLKISRGEIQGIKEYASLLGGQPYLACYWSGFNVWTLIPMLRLESDPATGSLRLRIEDSLKWNEMSLLGDSSIGVVPPLQFVLRCGANSGHLQTQDNDISKFHFTIDAVEVWCGSQKMETDVEKNFVWFLLLHAGWDTEDEVVLSEDGSRAERIVWTATPPEPPEIIQQQGFVIVGALSSLYSSLYRNLTAPSGPVTSLADEPEIGMLPRIVPDDLRSPRLPIWRFHQREESTE